MKQKIKAQVKSRWYYVFWGTATVSVVLGQLYVGTGYRLYASSLIRILDMVEFASGDNKELINYQ